MRSRGSTPIADAALGATCAVLCAVLLAGCEPTAPPDPPTVPASPMPADSATTGPVAPLIPAPSDRPLSPVPEGDRAVVDDQPPVTATVTVVATDLPAPWAVAPLPGGLALVTLRDDARLVVVDPGTGSVIRVGGTGADELREQTRPQGEGGLLGVAVGPEDGWPDAVTVFLYRTGDDANAVVRADLSWDDASGDDGSGDDAVRFALGALTTVLDGIPRAGNHNGGRLAFGPDGFLYVTTGDAGDRAAAQDPGSLSGKILRITPDGEAAPGNPVSGSPVWSLGHRNVQGIGWDAHGRMLASEFGQDTWDELNEIWPGENYGWPEVEGAGAGSASAVPVGGPAVADGFARPLVVWRTSDASPSGLAVVGDAAYLASLRGERLWRVPLGPGATDVVAVGAPQALLEDDGRLRDVVAAPDGSLWVLTNNTDGRGRPREGDDRLLHVAIVPD